MSWSAPNKRYFSQRNIVWIQNCVIAMGCYIRLILLLFEYFKCNEIPWKIWWTPRKKFFCLFFISFVVQFVWVYLRTIKYWKMSVFSHFLVKFNRRLSDQHLFNIHILKSFFPGFELKFMSKSHSYSTNFCFFLRSSRYEFSADIWFFHTISILKMKVRITYPRSSTFRQSLNSFNVSAINHNLSSGVQTSFFFLLKQHPISNSSWSKMNIVSVKR